MLVWIPKNMAFKIDLEWKLRVFFDEHQGKLNTSVKLIQDQTHPDNN